jgi:hypothetical protein
VTRVRVHFQCLRYGQNASQDADAAHELHVVMAMNRSTPAGVRDARSRVLALMVVLGLGLTPSPLRATTPSTDVWISLACLRVLEVQLQVHTGVDWAACAELLTPYIRRVAERNTVQ